MATVSVNLAAGNVSSYVSIAPLRNLEKSTRGFFPKLTQTKTRTAENMKVIRLNWKCLLGIKPNKARGFISLKKVFSYCRSP